MKVLTVSRLANQLTYGIISKFYPCKHIFYTRLRNTKGTALIDIKTHKIWFKEH